MFSQIHSASNGENQTHAIIDCFDVRYVVYFNSDSLNVEVNSYVVHLDAGGLLRRDCLPLFSLFSWGGFTKLYGSAA